MLLPVTGTVYSPLDYFLRRYIYFRSSRSSCTLVFCGVWVYNYIYSRWITLVDLVAESRGNFQRLLTPFNSIHRIIIADVPGTISDNVINFNVGAL